MLFFLLKNVKMPTTVGILTFMSKNIPCANELSMNILITWGPGAVTKRYFQCEDGK